MNRYISIADFKRMENEVASEILQSGVRKARLRNPEGATFLSHSSKDDHLMPVVVNILENHGATVYLDDKDPTLPGKPGREVAKILRSRIRGCRKFILFASQNTAQSKWVPWELGLSDGHQKAQNIAIFPAVETAYDTVWTTQEYLGVYDRIVWGDLEGFKQPLWMVWNQDDNTGSRLVDWLTR